jgi:hypothetical protein
MNIIQVERRLPDLMGALFGVTKVSNVLRNGKRVNGYLRVGWLDHVIIGQPMNGTQGYFSFKEAGTIG